MKILCFLVLLISLRSFAWTVIVISKPAAYVVNAKGERAPLKVGKKVDVGDTVFTEAGAKLKLLENKSVMVIGENSQVKIEKQQQKPVTLFLMKGQMRYQIDKPEAKNFNFKIPSIVAGVRGTEFFMSASPEKEVHCVLEGEVGAEIIASGAKAVVHKNIGWIREGNQEGKLLPTTEEQRKKWTQSTAL